MGTDRFGHTDQVIRRLAFAPAERSWRYPLPLSSPLAWAASDGMLAAEVPLPAVPSGHLIVPSFAAAGSPDHHCVLIDGADRTVTAGAGRPAEQHAGMPGGATRVHLDYFETVEDLTEARLCFRVNAPQAPGDYLATIGIRPRDCGTRPGGARDTQVLPVPARTQMAAPASVRARICSPTCVSMALDHFGFEHDFDELVVAAHHRPTGLYGVWPQNVWAATRWGALGAVETAVDWQTPCHALDAGFPIVASIAFEAGSLGGAPLPSSPGHLVIVRGIQNNRVLVNDPAADTVTDVPRCYDIDEFHAAWLSGRGVFYLFASPR